MKGTIRWTQAARDHIAPHRVLESEVEAAFRARVAYRRKARDLTIVIARSNGRVLFVVLVESREFANMLEVVTARAATRSEKALLLRRGKGCR